MATRRIYFLICIAAAILFLPFLGHVHLFDWDEINFAECAREMIVTKDYLRMQIDYMPFYEKPPLFIWLQVACMSLFGVGEYAARLPDALTGIATLLTLFWAGSKARNQKTGIWWAVLYAASWLPQIYFKSGIIDPVFNYFILLAFIQVWLMKGGQKRLLHAALGGLFIGLAVLTKGPVAILVSGLALLVFLLMQRGLKGYHWTDFLVMAAIGMLTMLLWFGPEAALHGWTFLREFIAYQAGLFGQNIADHEEPWYYHPIVLLIGCFPASLFLFQWRKKEQVEPPAAADFMRWMWILFWVVLILFSIVKTKIVHYSSLCYYPLTYIAAVQVTRLIEDKRQIRRWVQFGLLLIGGLLAIAILSLPLVGINKSQIIPLIQDPFAVGNLQASVHWSAAECLFGGLYLLAIIYSVALMRRHFRRAILLLCIVQVLMIQVAVLHFSPKVEAYSQRAAIEFFQSLAGKDVYLHPLGYKSYAHLFYSRKLPSTNPSYYHRVHSDVGASTIMEANEAWLLSGPIDKPAYFICKVSDAKHWRSLPQLHELGARNGFIFFVRWP
ncbi:MAG: glycosyltransferase family 39 protein [Bacteroidetes bacterium]|nr:glycosyltransferase family 39 protein [Bacteroidota bacterium]